ncbi:MAG: R2-like ligand-binding oxidase [Firmicutes bacterium]|uniref:R2-like ligand binding oxidase n=1 Tax=Melghirimyces thermohalophilus TaxID=1236220 RepID=A0A1G6KNT2_9BACL|nr:R2-like ligand-binding oxidase [Melghirimyces thermohalophilus]MDA8353551.1 R2-like ligand-binding oxidase [Bacillota bacterium]SDC32498.1 ribonucleoside-diphosphate reductase beta chain [Melghirimyces thermohalophilus]
MRKEMVTTSGRGIRTDSLPYRLFRKAKVLGVWDPEAIDFSRDLQDWNSLTEGQRQQTLRLITLFQGGEEAVTLDLLPLMMTIAEEGRIEEEMFLTTFLFEEAKHTEFFRLVLNVLGQTQDLSHLHSPTYRKIFYEILPESMNRLKRDQSPEAVAEASTVYNMFIEGVLAETGYHSFYQGLHKAQKMPGLMEGIGYIKRDESRHIGYGTFLLQRLISERQELYERVEKKLEELAPLAFALNQEGMEGETESHFGVPLADTLQFTERQLAVRMEVLARAKHKSVDEIYKTRESALGVE